MVEKNRSPLYHYTRMVRSQGCYYLWERKVLFPPWPDVRHMEANISPPPDPVSTWNVCYGRITVEFPTMVSISCRLVGTRARMDRMQESRERMLVGTGCSGIRRDGISTAK